MITLEQVEKLREYANVTYDEAREALEKAEGDILSALIDLERQGKVETPKGGGQYSFSKTTLEVKEDVKEDFGDNTDSANQSTNDKSAFSKHMKSFFGWIGDLLHKGNINSFVVERKNEQLMKLPVTVLVLLLIFAFWFMVPLLVVGLFFGFRYYFQGPHLGTSKVNSAMDTVANAAEEIKNDIKK